MPRIGGAFLKAALPDMLAPLQGPTTTTIYRLLPSTLLPVEPFVDIIPAVTPNRQALDVTLTATRRSTYRVTRLPIQDGSTTTPNVHKDLKTMQVRGVISGSPPLQLAGALGNLLTLAGQTGGAASRAVALSAQVPSGFGHPRRDLMQLQMLELLADRREIVMAVGPEGAMPRCFIEDITRLNTPDLGESTEVSISLVEARIVSPQFAEALLDLDETLGGAGETVDAGGQPVSDIGTPPDLSGGGFG